MNSAWRALYARNPGKRSLLGSMPSTVAVAYSLTRRYFVRRDRYAIAALLMVDFWWHIWKKKQNQQIRYREEMLERRRGRWTLELELPQPVHPIGILLAQADPQPGQEGRGKQWRREGSYTMQSSASSFAGELGSLNSLCGQQKRPASATGNSSCPWYTCFGTPCPSWQLLWTTLLLGVWDGCTNMEEIWVLRSNIHSSSSKHVCLS